MPLLPVGGIGGGSVLGLGPLPNTFGDSSTIDRAAAEVLRDAQTADAAWLALYDGNFQNWIRLVWDDGEVIQRRNSGGTGWEDVTNVISGRTGDDGSQGSFIISIHVNSTATPTPNVPVGGSYDVDTGVLTPPTGTTQFPSAPGAGEDVYTSEAEINPLVQSGAVTPAWSPWVERAHLSGGISHVEHDAELTGQGTSADPLGITTPLTADEKTKIADLRDSLDLGAPTTQNGGRFEFSAPTGYTSGGFPSDGQLVQFLIGTVDSPDDSDVMIRVGSDDYELEEVGGRVVSLHEFVDDTQYLALGKGSNLFLMGPSPTEVVDISVSGLPAPDSDTEGKVYLDRSIPAAYMIHETFTTRMPPTGTFNAYANPDYVGARGSDPGTSDGYTDTNTQTHPNSGHFYWNWGDHLFRVWQRYFYQTTFGTDTYGWHWRNAHNVGNLLGGSTGVYVGYTDTELNLVERVPYPIDSTRRYIGVTLNDQGSQVIRVRELDNTTYVAPADPQPQYDFVTIGLYGPTPAGGQTAAQVQAAIQAAINSLIDGAPSDRNTLNELSDAINSAISDLVNGAPSNLDTLGKIASEIEDSFVDASISGQEITLTRRSGATVPITIPGSGMGTSDGVISGVSLDPATNILTVTRTIGSNLTVDLTPLAGGGLTQAQVDARVQAGVLDWAEEGDTSTIPDAKIPPEIARDSEVQDSFTGASETGGTLTLTRRSGVNEVDIPVGGGTGDDAADWAEEGNTDVIPSEKLAPGGLVAEALIRTATGQVWRPLTFVAIPAANVSLIGGNANEYAITTGKLFTSLPHGQRFFFTTLATNTGGVFVTVDNAPRVEITKSRFDSSQANRHLASSLTPSDLSANDPTFITYDEITDRLVWTPARSGNAGLLDIGTDEDELVPLEAGGVFPLSVIPPEIARDSEVEDSFTGASETGGTLTLVRRSGSNPATINVGGASDGTLLFGDGAPNNADGIDGDSYYDRTAQSLYSKDSGTWTLEGTITGVGSGLTEAQVDARVQAGVLDWAEEGDTSDIPATKLPGSETYFVTTSYVAADNQLVMNSRVGDPTPQPFDELLFAVPNNIGSDANPLTISLDGGTARPLTDNRGQPLSASNLTARQVGLIYVGNLGYIFLPALVPDWANEGNSDLVPTGKLGSGTADISTFLRGDGAWETPGGGASNGRVFYIPPTGVSQVTPSLIEMTTGYGLSSLRAGDKFVFISERDVDAAPRVDIDSASGAEVRRAADGGGLTRIGDGEISNGDLVILVCYDGDDLLHINPRQGLAAGYNVGTAENQLAALNNNGRFDTARLGSGTADSTTFLRGDGIWVAGSGGGGDDAATWAEEGNTDLIPVSKLRGRVIPCTSSISVGSTDNTLGLTSSDYAGDLNDGDTLLFLPQNGAANTMPFMVEFGSETVLPMQDSEGNPIVGNAIVIGELYFLTFYNDTYRLIDPQVSDWAIDGNASQIPESKIPFGVEDWAETGNTDLIPDSKLRFGGVFLGSAVSYTSPNLDVTLDAVPTLREIFVFFPPATIGTDSSVELTLSVNGGAARNLLFASTGDRVNEADITALQPVLGYSGPQANYLLQTRGLSIGAIDARIADWAEEGNSTDIPDSKIPDEITRDSEVENSFVDASISGQDITLTRRSGATVPIALPAGSTSDGVISGVSLDPATNVLTITRTVGGNLTVDLSGLDDNGLTQGQVDARVQAGVADWAEEGDSSLIPESKLPTAATEGLNQAEVDARVEDGVEDWAEEGNVDVIPNSKLPALGGGLDEGEVDDRVNLGLNDIYNRVTNEVSAISFADVFFMADASSSFGTMRVPYSNVRADIRNVSREEIADWAEEGNTDVIPDAKIGENGRYFICSATHNGNTFFLTTGFGLISLQNGHRFYFRATATNINVSNANVDGIGASEIRGLNRQGNGDASLPGGYIQINMHYILTWDEPDGYFRIEPVEMGTAVRKNSGNREFEIPDLESGGVWHPDRIPSVIARLAQIYDWSEEGNADDIPTNKLNNARLTVQDDGTQELQVAGAILNFGSGLDVQVSGSVATITTTGSGPPASHTDQYLAIAPDGSDHVFVEGDFTGALGVAYAAGVHTATAPTYTGFRHVAIARLESDPDLTFIDIDSSGFNQVGAFAKVAGTIMIGTDTYEVWKSNQVVDASGSVVEAR